MLASNTLAGHLFPIDFLAHRAAPVSAASVRPPVRMRRTPLGEDAAVKRTSTAEFHLLNETREGGRIPAETLKGAGKQRNQKKQNKTHKQMTGPVLSSFHLQASYMLFCSLPPFVWNTL